MSDNGTVQIIITVLLSFCIQVSSLILNTIGYARETIPPHISQNSDSELQLQAPADPGNEPVHIVKRGTHFITYIPYILILTGCV